MAKLSTMVYGDALLEAVLDEGVMDPVAEEVKSLLAAMEETPEFMAFLTNPQIEKEAKKQSLQEMFQERFSKALMGFVILVVEKDRQKELPGFFTYFLELVRKEKRIGVVTVSSSCPLRKEQKDRVEKRLLETTGFISLECTYQVDPSLIGGLVIRIGDRVLDSSIRTEIGRMAKELAKGTVQEGEGIS